MAKSHLEPEVQTELATVTPTAVATAQRDTSPEAMLMLAIERGITPDGLEKLVTLQLAILKQRAEAAFNLSIQQFQSTLRPIYKNKTANLGSYSVQYATLEQIAEHISPMMAANGLSFSFDSVLADNAVKTTCTIHHIDGHSRSHTFSAPIDGTAKMNAMQKAASALTYSRRYALVLALGITFTEDDDDGAACSPPDVPNVNANVPQSQPRGERATKEDCESLWKDWQSATSGDFAAYVAWASGVTAMTEEQVGKVASWTKQGIDHCRDALGRIKR